MQIPGGGGNPLSRLHSQLLDSVAASAADSGGGGGGSSSEMNGNAAAAAAAAAAATAVPLPVSSPSSVIGAGSNSSSTPQHLPQALQNLQRLLQSQLANVNPLQLQQALQRQQVSHLKQ